MRIFLNICCSAIFILLLEIASLNHPVLAQEGEAATAHQPNEMGDIMVILYHGIGPTESTWTRSKENFREDLELLYSKGYRPINLVDFAQDRIRTAAGYTPVVLTFDDGRQDNFNIIEVDGRPIIDPDSAVGILEQFHGEHPDFPLEATFFLNSKSPFKQDKWVSFKLNHLIEQGMDVGNHMQSHVSLKTQKDLNADKIAHLIGGQAQFLEEQITVEPGYRVNTLALCHGGRPRDKVLWKFLASGQYGEFQYQNIAILNVGSAPAPSPVSKKFNLLSIPRVRANSKGAGMYHLRAFLEWFDRNPSRRFVSDGDPQTVTVPENLAKLVDPAKLNGAVLNLTP